MYAVGIPAWFVNLKVLNFLEKISRLQIDKDQISYSMAKSPMWLDLLKSWVPHSDDEISGHYFD